MKPPTPRVSLALVPLALAALLSTGCQESDVSAVAPAEPALAVDVADGIGVTAIAARYVADFVATSSSATLINAAGDVVGTSYPVDSCGSFCTPLEETVVWRAGQRHVLPALPGWTGTYPTAINAQGWIAGVVGVPGTVTRAVLWRPSGAGYSITDLGLITGTRSADVAGIDDQGRVVGFATAQSIRGPAVPFLWTPSGGMSDLAAQGYPADKPLAVSPGGTVATSAGWYRLGAPSSATLLPAPPAGFRTPGLFSTVINDAGLQGRMLGTTTSQPITYMFRYHPTRGWKQLSTLPTGSLSFLGFGGITPTGDLTATIQNTGFAASGPHKIGTPLAAKLSPAYLGATVGATGGISAAGAIVAKVMIGRSERLMKLVPATPCTGNCVRSASVAMRGTFVQDPARPGSCFNNGVAYNDVTVKVRATTETGATLSNVQVRGRVLDDYRSDTPMTATTNNRGVATFSYRGGCAVGAVAFLVDDIVAGGRSFDRTAGVVTGWVIPR